MEYKTHTDLLDRILDLPDLARAALFGRLFGRMEANQYEFFFKALEQEIEKEERRLNGDV
jgi:hypothetical protein